MKRPEENKIKKLPVWVKEYIDYLEKEITTASKVIADLQGDRQKLYNGKVYVGGLTSPRIFLDEMETVTFVIGDYWTEVLRVRLDGDHIDINGGAPISVYPRSSNVINIKISDYFCADKTKNKI